MATRKQRGTIRQVGGVSSGANLGGMGTGGVELRADGRFHFWNMLNCRPWANYQKGAPRRRRGSAHHTIGPVQPAVGDTDFFLRVRRPGERPVYRWLFTDNGMMVATGSHFFRTLKYFFIKSCEAIEYRAEYPFIHLRYVDSELPVEASLRAWSPFIPRDVKNSSLPGAYLDFTVTNTSDDPLEVSLVWQQQNFSGYAAGQVVQEHRKRRLAGATLVQMAGSTAETDHDSSGCMSIWALPADGQTVTAVAANPYMQNLIWAVHQTGGLAGPLYPPHLKREELNPTPPEGVPNKGWLCVRQELSPGEAAELRLGMAWYYPNHRSIRGTRIGHVYENWFSDSADAARYLIRNREKLQTGSRLLGETLMTSSLPETLRLALLDQLNTLTKSTHFSRDGRFGLQEGHGCCAFNTMDVDHYSSYALSLLMPQLRRKVLEMQTELVHPETGKIHHGLPGTIEPIEPDGREGYNRWDCCCQYVLQVYRDTKWAGDRELLQECWPAARRAIKLIAELDFYEISLPYIEGGITYDHWRMKGVVTFMAGLYLAALRATEEMARTLDEPRTARWARERFGRGRESFERYLHNGEQYLLYYARRPKGWKPSDEQRGEEGHLQAQRPSFCCTRPEACIEIADTGVMTDALNGNATAAVMGLGAFLDPKRVRKQLRLILDRNYQPENSCIVNGTYPDGHFLDEWPFSQWQTPWTGSEHFLAAQLYAAGMERQGDRVLDRVFDRHVREGMRFDHTECNNHYSRPLCIWAAYAARLGLDLDALGAGLSIRPTSPEYDGLLLTATATCRLHYAAGKTRTRAQIEILDGELPIETLTLGVRFAGKRAEATVGGKARRGDRRTGGVVNAAVETGDGAAAVRFARKLKLKSGQTLGVLVR